MVGNDLNTEYYRNRNSCFFTARKSATEPLDYKKIKEYLWVLRVFAVASASFRNPSFFDGQGGFQALGHFFHPHAARPLEQKPVPGLQSSRCGSWPADARRPPAWWYRPSTLSACMPASRAPLTILAANSPTASNAAKPWSCTTAPILSCNSAAASPSSSISPSTATLAALPLASWTASMAAATEPGLAL